MGTAAGGVWLVGTDDHAAAATMRCVQPSDAPRCVTVMTVLLFIAELAVYK